MSIAQVPLARRNLATAPINIIAFGMRIMGAARVVVRGDDAAAGNVKAIYNDESAGGRDICVNIEGNGLSRVNRQLGHLMPPNKIILFFARNRCQRGSINDVLDRINAALDLLRCKLELVCLFFREGLFAEPKEPRLEPR